MNWGSNSFWHQIDSYMKIFNKNFIKATAVSWLKVMVLLLDNVVALILIIFILRYFKIEIPLPIIVIAAILIGTLLFIQLRAIIPDFRRKPVTGQDRMIGLKGRVTKTLSPTGNVAVEGEHWKAKSVNDDVIGADESVEVMEVNGLILLVSRKLES